MAAQRTLLNIGSRIVIQGASATGKTSFVKELLKHKNEIFVPPPQRLVYVYKYKLNFFKDFPSVEFCTEIPDDFSPDVHNLLIVDDCMLDKSILSDLASLFARGRHLGLTSIFATQSLFLKDPNFRLISLNASHIILFNSIRSAYQIENFGRQIFGKRTETFLKAIKKAHQEPYGYLLVNLTPGEANRLRSNILPNETEIVYVE